MATSSSRRFPVTVSHLLVVGCPICLGTVAYRSGGANEVPPRTTPGCISKRSASRASGQTSYLGTGAGRLVTVLAWALSACGHGALRDA